MHVRPFEIALIGFFVIVAILGIVSLRIFTSSPSESELLYGDRVEIWGVFDKQTVDEFLFDLTQEDDALNVVSYRQVDIQNFENAFVNAVAEGKSPDLLLVPHTLLVSLRTKLTPISYQTISDRTFRDTYVDGAEIYMRSDGIYGIPAMVDPLVMYWNRDILSSASIAQPPKTWEQLIAETSKAVTQLDDSRNIIQSTVAFGEYRNVLRAKEIMSMLFLQTGNSIVEENNGQYEVTFGQSQNNTLSPGEAVLSFYTQFALTTKETYSWNRLKPLDRDEFIAGRLGLYFGRGSEWETIERENPNLNYDVSRVPQGAGVTTFRTYGDFYAFAIPRGTQRSSGAYAVARLLTTPTHATTLADALNLAPAPRAGHTGSTNNPFKDVLYQSALIARGWLDPAPKESAQVLQDMVEGVTTGTARQERSVLDAVYKLENLF